MTSFILLRPWLQLLLGTTVRQPCTIQCAEDSCPLWGLSGEAFWTSQGSPEKCVTNRIYRKIYIRGDYYRNWLVWLWKAHIGRLQAGEPGKPVVWFSLSLKAWKPGAPISKCGRKMDIPAQEERENSPFLCLFIPCGPPNEMDDSHSHW